MARRYLKDRVVFYPLAEGLDSGREPMLAQEGTVHLENLEYKRRGTLSKREGYTDADSNGTQNETIATYKDRPIVLGTQATGYYNGTTATNGEFETLAGVGASNQWYFKTTVKSLAGEQGKIIKHPSHVRFANRDIVAYSVQDSEEETYTLKLVCYHQTTSFDLTSATLNSSAGQTQNARLIVGGDNKCFCFYVNSSRVLSYRSINSNGVIGSETAVPDSPTIPNPIVNGHIDVCLAGANSDQIYICTVGTANNVTHVMFNANAGTASAGTVSVTGVEHVACSTCDEEAVLLHYNGTTVKAEGYDTDLNTSITESTIFTGLSNLKALAAVNESGAGFENEVYILGYDSSSGTWIQQYIDTSGTGSVGGTQSSMQGGDSALYSKPVMDANNNCWAWLAPYDDKDGIVNYTNRTALLAGPHLYDNADVAYAKAHIGMLADWQQPADTFYAVPDITVDTDLFCPLTRLGDGDSAFLTLVKAERINPTAIEGVSNLLTSGSIPMEFDGQRQFEQGFLQIPRTISVSGVAGSSTLLDNGAVYGYKYVYEHRDAQGNWHRSAPSVVEQITVDTSAHSAIAVTATKLILSWRTNVKIAFYRTEGDGSTYYRLGTRENDDSIVFTDNIADATIASNAVLYTNGGVLEDIQPPPTSVQTIYQNRHFCVDGERPSTRIRYSKEFIRYVGVQHNDLLYVDVSADDGDITALSVLGDRLIIFKENSIYITYGRGKEKNGVPESGYDYASPVLIHSSKGCINQKSIVKIPDGLIFQGRGGIFLLTNDMSVDLLFSDKVQYQYKTYAIDSLTQAVHYPLKESVIFFSSDSSGIALVYNYKYKQWTTYSNFQGLSATYSMDTVFFIDGSDGINALDLGTDLTSTNYKDDGTFVTAKLDTGWISFAGIMGFQRVRELYVLGYNLLDHDFNIRVGYDFDPKLAAAQQYTSSLLDNFGVSKYFDRVTASSWDQQAYIIRCVLPKQKCTSIRICIDDAIDSTVATTPTFELVGLAFVVAVKSGAHRIEANRIA